MVLGKGVCVNISYCTTCDDEGHRVGDVWKTDSCTTCQCNEHGSTCSTRTCPEDPICDEGYIIAEIPDTGDECCGPRKKCKVRPVENCTIPSVPESDCGYGKVSQLIEAPGKCPQYACVCLNPEDCPQVVVPEEDPNPGEEWVLDESGCCPRYVTKCSGECPKEECPEFYNLIEQPLKEGQCCPSIICEIPKDACIYENRFEVTSIGFQRELTEEEEPEKKLYKIGESWEDGLCLKCKCVMGSKGSANHQCSEQVCTTLNNHPDKGNYQLDLVETAGQCCPSIVRTACIDDYEVIEVGSRLDDPLNGCRSVECVKTAEGTVEKIEQIFSCDESCSLGWVYEPSPLYPTQCCGSCVQITEYFS
ncbi:hemocytin-like [Palaemon carinicauda]|uniref:hemocytin-like n=1 Tax=Palaemon carinicauda TaxID=392227 RepID=UPI0035B69F17